MHIATRTFISFFALFLISLQVQAGANIPFAFMPLLENFKPPTFIQEAETTWDSNTTPRTTASFNVLAGDILVAYAVRETDGGASLMEVSGGSLTWIRKASVHTGTGDWTEVIIWWAKVDANKSMTVSFTSPWGHFGGNVLTFRGASGIGAAVSNTVASGAPSINITTLRKNSAVVVVNGDWNAADGTTRAWRLSATESSYAYDSTHYTAFAAYHSNIGNSGTYNVGLSAPSSLKSSIAALEVIGSDNRDLCSDASPAIGTLCNSGTIYAGQFDGGKYMVTPGGCTDSATPTCNGTDTLTKSYIGSSGTQGVDIAGITDVATASTKSSSSQRGDVITPLIVADASTSSDSAAHYCSNMVYGGYSDWYLPSKSELAYIYCHSDAGYSHSSSAPEEDVNCATYGTAGGPTGELPGFDGGEYTSATEIDQDYRWRIGFQTGNFGGSWKGFTGTFVRCVRRY